MIFLCQNCGHRINQRTGDRSIWNPDEPSYKIEIDESEIGKYLLYNHKPFCSEECIEYAKSKPYIMKKDVKPYNDYESGFYNPDRPNGIETWKTERKIRRIRNKEKIKKINYSPF